MPLPTLAEIEAAQKLVYSVMPPTPQYSWPLLNQRFGPEAELWLKHENHSPLGAFKLRSTFVYCTWLKETNPGITTLVAATRGNHGQGVGLAARYLGLKAIIVVPHGNSREKNLAMKAQGVTLIEHGDDFQASVEHAQELSREPGAILVESFHPRLVEGTATYALELFQNTPPLDAVYVPIGMASSICGVAAVRNALGLKTEIIGVVAADAPASAVSFRERRVVPAPAHTLLADGLACRQPKADAMQILWDNVARVIEVSEAEIAHAMRVIYEDTHNIAEGAAAAALAGALQENTQKRYKRLAVILTGGNVDRELYLSALSQPEEAGIQG
ncbi:MAG TPA: threonine dehydratase [Acidobacteriaceae bacterium]